MKPTRRNSLAAASLAMMLLAASCGSGGSDSADPASDDPTTAEEVAESGDVSDSDVTEEDADSDAMEEDADSDAMEEDADSDAMEEDADSDVTEEASVGSASCDEIAALFVTAGSVNSELVDPEVSGTCDGDNVVVTSNGIPDYTYIETSPGSPDAANYVFTIPATPTMADAVTDVPDLGTAAVALNGVPIYGPTEGTGGDVLSLVGALSECGSHNGPTGFHIHQILTTASTDCLFSPDEVAAAPQLVGYAFDGYPIYTGIDQYSSSWELTDESLFATDTWAAHSYVEGSGDLDQCNGLTDADGNYAYYTTETFPYVIGCYSGVVDVSGAGGGGGGGR